MRKLASHSVLFALFAFFTLAAPAAEQTFAYTNFGAPAKVTSRKHIDDLDLDLVTYANNIRLNFKKTDFAPGQIQLTVRIGAGQLTEPRDKPGLAVLATQTLLAGGLGKHTADDLVRLTTGRQVKTTFRVADDALVFQGATNRADLLLQLQLIAAAITDPAYRPESLTQAQKQFEQTNLTLAHTPQGPLQRDIPRILASGDPRFGYPKKDELAARTLAEVRAWLAPQLATGPIEIAIVGDLDPAATLDAVARTLGALRTRAAKPALDAERRITIAKPETLQFVIASEIPQGALALYWPTTDARDARLTRRLNLLAAIFNERLNTAAREKFGDAYSPKVGSDCSETYRDYGFLYAMVIIDPANTPLLEKAISNIADDLQKNGVTPDELTRAKLPILTGLRESARANGYWLQAVLSRAQEEPQRLDWSRTRATDIESITKADIDALAKKYLAPSRAFRATVVPVK